MFNIGASELLIIVIVAILVIGPKDMPLAMRTAGRWIGKIRRVSAHFRAGVDAIVREAELEEMEKKWKARNEEIMRRTAATSITDQSSEDTPAMTGPPVAEDPLVVPDDSPADHGIDLPGIPDPNADDPVLPAPRPEAPSPSHVELFKKPDE